MSYPYSTYPSYNPLPSYPPPFFAPAFASAPPFASAASAAPEPIVVIRPEDQVSVDQCSHTAWFILVIVVILLILGGLAYWIIEKKT